MVQSFMICMSELFLSQMKITFCGQSKKYTKAKTQSKRPSRSYRVNYFLPFIDHIISHLNSWFSQELKASFHGNYMAPALVNTSNVFPAIVNDMKTEYMNNLAYSNDLSQEVDRCVANCTHCNRQFVNTLTDSIFYAGPDLYPSVHVI